MKIKIKGFTKTNRFLWLLGAVLLLLANNYAAAETIEMAIKEGEMPPKPVVSKNQ
jgi:hypothetical protein